MFLIPGDFGDLLLVSFSFGLEAGAILLLLTLVLLLD
jgi:hypothetical protein